MTTPLNILQQYWGYHQFRSLQNEIINSVLQKQNTIVLLPTGGGKSICYQIPTLLSDGICIVVSPLIALIKDQVKGLKEKNIKAVALTSQLSQDEVIVAFDNLQFGNYRFLYISPEKLQSPLIQEKIKQLKVSIIAIDEAHCISEWGHDFRPSYLKLSILKQLQPNATIIALTATATDQVLNDIKLNLQLDNAVLFKKSFQRKNLFYNVIFTENIEHKLLQIVNEINAPTIIYTNTRRQTKEISTLLNKHLFKSTFYHGGCSAEEKNSAFTSWMEEKTPIIVATNAFGMGIDKANVRAVIHINIPNSIENFIQEAGRAGRDQKKAFSYVLVNNALIHTATSKFSTSQPSVKEIKQVYKQLNNYYGISYGDLPINSFNFSLQEFCTTYKLPILKTYNAIKILERENILFLDENYTKKSTIHITLSNQHLLNYIHKHTTTENLLKTILRTYGGLFEHPVQINEFLIANKLTKSKAEIVSSLKNLHNDGIINYSFENTTSKLLFLTHREDHFTINRIAKSIEKQYFIKLEKLKATISFLQNNTQCKNKLLLSYFGEIIKENCGNCCYCTSKKPIKTNFKQLQNSILSVLNNNNLSSAEIINQLSYSEPEILNSLQILLEKNKITITSQNKFKRTDI